ncbi:metallophosphoesterase [Lysinibacillus macroides]|uniref:Serine/threonine protein phosphatase n=1 Tax=Lysinibacillus macroides TaxID=33935 RepID=A0A0M9DI39_9BACI|nr:metallophosphoesterase [Lysinibacillus macroides]KOY80886.1 serine/threonine protein phosphatase [Lysinibacillus macroides]QPR68968.1 metallophosphoesterase [Lysinibacillus macroides]
MNRILAISDIHGELTMFEELLLKANYHPMKDQLFLLGDYIDRGPASSGVLNLVGELQAQGARVLLGNHEAIMLHACRSGHTKPWNHWVGLCGGEATLASYGYQLTDFDEAIQNQTLPSFIQTLPKLEEHLKLIETFETYIELEDVIFVHGGVVPGVALSETDPLQFLWIREEFHAGYQGEKTVIFGHTPTYRLHHNPTDYRVYFGENNIIGIDGGAVFGGQLHAFEWPSRKILSVENKKPTSSD